uniref:cation transporting ATPase C-terminal domain-containing protein n=1 Tax=Serratia quinivorans TaxID=137545 RepID=UPI0035C6DEF7
MLAARKINDEKNIFTGVFTNPMFCGVWLTIVIAHFVIIQFGSVAMKVHVGGLTGQQWIISIIVGFTALPVNLFIKFFPDTVVFLMGDEDPEDIIAAAEDYKELRAQAEQKKQDLQHSQRMQKL